MKKLLQKLAICLLGFIAGSILTISNKSEDNIFPQWTLLANDVTTTVYNACEAQCNADYYHTASMYKIVPERIPEIRILAMERTMMAEYGITYGTIVMISGAGKYDGLWSVQDTMNKRFAGQHKIDLLVPSHIKHGKWKNVRIYIPANEHTRNYCQNQKII